MLVVGALRIKNEARWIERCLASIAGLCDEIHVLDDHSDDGTPDICERMGVTLYRSPFDGLDESRDKNYLLDRIEEKLLPNVVLCIDGDEELESGGCERLRAAATRRTAKSWSLRVAYLWDSPDQVRVDGVYGRFSRVSMWRHRRGLRFQPTRHGGNFHCGNVPVALQSGSIMLPVQLLHYGYMYREDRIRKFGWYNAKDPANMVEDQYRHVCQGDLPEIPATARLMHAGPLRLRPLSI